MDQEPGDVDYLAGAKLRSHTQSFSEVVREAFLLEHKCLQDQDIAEHMDVSPGRVSQILGSPRKLKAESVHKLIACFDSRTHRKNILKAWQRDCFGEELDDLGAPLIGSSVDATTIRRIDRLIRQVRPDRALKVTTEALVLVQDPEHKQQLLDRAFYLHMRLDQSGQAMQVAQTVYAWGRTDYSTEKMATGLVMKARILRTLEGVDAATIQGVHTDALALIETLPVALQEKQGGSFTSSRALDNEHIANVLTYHDEHGGAEDFLRESLQSVRARLMPSDSVTRKAGAFHLEARIHLALGEFTAAEEALEKSFVIGELKSLSVGAKAGVVQGRILAARGEIDAAIDYYEQVAKLCESERNLYHLRLAERDLAILKAHQFPG